MEFIQSLRNNSNLLIGVMITLVGAFAGSSIGMIVSLLVFLFFLISGEVKNLFLFFYTILLFSDSREGFFEFAVNIKPILAILFGVYSMILSKQAKGGSYFLGGFVLFFLLGLILLQQSPIPFTSFQKLTSYALLIFSTPIYIQILIKRYGTEVLKDFVYWLILFLVLGLSLNYLGFADYTNLAGRYRGLMGNPNGLGILLLITFLFYQVSEIAFDDLYSKNEKILILVVIFLNVIWTGSRTAIFIIIGFYAIRFAFTFSRFVGITAVLIIAFAYNQIFTNLPEVIRSLSLESYFRLETLEEGSGRTIAWEFANFHIDKNFWFGKGFTYTEYLYKINYTYLSMLGHQGNAHNSYLTLWLDTGLIGIVLFFTPLVYYFLRISGRFIVVFPLLFCVGFAINFESWLAASLNPFTIVLFMILSFLTYAYYDEDGQKSKDNSLDFTNKSKIDK